MRNQYRIEDNAVYIVLKRKDGKHLETIIDLSDFNIADKLSSSWYAHYIESTKTFYVRGDVYSKGNGLRKRVYLHRWIMGEPDDLLIDHKNTNTLDNRCSNLRLATKSINMHNLNGTPNHNTTGSLNVYWDDRRKRWRAAISVDRKYRHLGYFPSKEDAIQAVIQFRTENNLGGLQNVN